MDKKLEEEQILKTIEDFTRKLNPTRLRKIIDVYNKLADEQAQDRSTRLAKIEKHLFNDITHEIENIKDEIKSIKHEINAEITK